MRPGKSNQIADAISGLIGCAVRLLFEMRCPADLPDHASKRNELRCCGFYADISQIPAPIDESVTVTSETNPAAIMIRIIVRLIQRVELSQDRRLSQIQITQWRHGRKLEVICFFQKARAGRQKDKRSVITTFHMRSSLLYLPFRVPQSCKSVPIGSLGARLWSTLRRALICSLS